MQASRKQPNPQKCDKNLFKTSVRVPLLCNSAEHFLESLSASAEKEIVSFLSVVRLGCANKQVLWRS